MKRDLQQDCHLGHKELLTGLTSIVKKHFKNVEVYFSFDDADQQYMVYFHYREHQFGLLRVSWDFVEQHSKDCTKGEGYLKDISEKLYFIMDSLEEFEEIKACHRVFNVKHKNEIVRRLCGLMYHEV